MQHIPTADPDHVLGTVTESLTVNGHTVGMVMAVLTPPARMRVAKSFVGAALVAFDPQYGELVNDAVFDILTRYISFTVDEDTGGDVPAWWGLVIPHALIAFLRVNGLEQAVRRDVYAFTQGRPHDLNAKAH